MASEKANTSSADELPAPKPAGEQQQKLTASCHCGLLTLELPEPPTSLNECRCSLCWKYGALWAYYLRRKVTVTVAATTTTDPPGQQQGGRTAYVRSDGAGSGQGSFHFCSRCGCVTHWWGCGLDGGSNPGGDDEVMGVNARMLPERALEGVERSVSYC
ncbi:Mss4-like protein [Xylariaceae sp. FL0804]|nr:Mss4-like protein [Xylariaceae sp. FL0804]